MPYKFSSSQCCQHSEVQKSNINSCASYAEAMLNTKLHFGNDCLYHYVREITEKLSSSDFARMEKKSLKIM